MGLCVSLKKNWWRHAQLSATKLVVGCLPISFKVDGWMVAFQLHCWRDARLFSITLMEGLLPIMRRFYNNKHEIFFFSIQGFPSQAYQFPLIHEDVVQKCEDFFSKCNGFVHNCEGFLLEGRPAILNKVGGGMLTNSFQSWWMDGRLPITLLGGRPPVLKQHWWRDSYHFLLKLKGGWSFTSGYNWWKDAHLSIQLMAGFLTNVWKLVDGCLHFNAIDGAAPTNFSN